MRNCVLRELGRIRYGDALDIQQQVAAGRKQGVTPDHLLLLEHPHVITMGRNGHAENLLASDEVMARTGIEYFPTDRGGDVTYHGPGQLVGYPILDLRDWKRDVGAYVRALEQTLIDTLGDYGIEAIDGLEDLEEVELVNRVDAHVIDAMQLGMRQDVIDDHPSQLVGRQAGEHCTGEARNARTGVQEPFEEAVVARKFVAND